MFYNTKIKLLFVIICILQHIFNQYSNFIDLGQQSRSFLLHFGEYFVRSVSYTHLTLPTTERV